MHKKYFQTIIQVFVILSVVLTSIVPTSQVDAQVNTNPTKESIGKEISSSNASFLSLSLLERPNAVKGERPNLNETLQEPYRTILCVANCSNTTPGVTVSQTWSEVGEHKTFFFKVLCPDWGCSKVDIYYTATLAVDWAVFIPWTSYARIGAGTLFGGGTGETGNVQCGASNVNSSSCTISTSGVIPAEIMNADPSAGYHGWHFNINSWGGPGAAWQYAYTTFTVTASLDPNFLSGDAEAFCNDPCGDNSESSSQGYVGDPINTNTGAFFYPIDGLSFPNSPELDFKYTYLSAAKDKYTSPMGYGWTHNKDIRLIFSNQPEGVSGSVLFKHPSGNLYKFFDSGYGRYEPYGGLTSKLVRNNSSPITYTVTDQKQNVYLFDENGVLLRYTTTDGKVLNYLYNTSGNLSQVNMQNGTRYIDFVYDSNDKLISVTDHTNRIIEFEYDTSGNLVSTADVLGQEWNYEYDANHLMLEVIDPLGNTKVRNEYVDNKVTQQFNGENELVVGLTYTTDQNGNKVTLVEDALGNETAHAYDSRETLVTQTNALNLDIEKTYDNNFRPMDIVDANGNSTALTWSEDGANLLRVIDAEGGQTDITYNTLNLPTSVIDPRGHLTTYEYDGVLLTRNTNALNQETTYTYTTEGHLESVTDPLGNITSYTYDSYGQRTSMTDPLGSTWTYTYDSLGRLINTTDPLGHVTHNEYDSAGRLIKVTQNYDPNKTQNEDSVWNIVTEYTYDVRGNQTSIADTFSRVTQYEYDNADRLIKSIDPAGNETINTYNTAGQLVAITDALGRTTQYQYDAAGRLTSTTDALGNTTSTSYNPDGTVLSTTDALGRTTSYLYDDVKRVTTVTLPNGSQTHNTYDESGNLLTTTDVLGNVTTYEYDALNRLIKTTDALGGITENFYDAAGRLVQTKDARNYVTNYAYDDAGRLTSVTDALGNITTYTYDVLGRRTSVTDANNNTSTYTYDDLNRVITMTDALGNSVETTYDALGQTLSQTDANGNTTSFNYDLLNRLISQTDAENNQTTFSYDVLGNRTGVTDANGHVSIIAYNALNQAIAFTDANSNTTTNQYDAVGNLTAYTDALNNATSTTYNNLNQPTIVTDPMGNETTRFYNSRGELIYLIDAENITTKYEYDALGRLTAVIENYQAGIPADVQTNVRTEYTYDANGNRLTIKDGNGNITTFVYDALNRLISETDPLGNEWSYTYDGVGNRISMTDANGAVTNYTYDNANRLISIDYAVSADVTFGYDAGGRRISMTDGLGVTTWTYNDINQVTAITDPFGKTVSYSYDSVGNQSAINYPNAQTVSYSYDSANRLTTVNGLSSTVNYQYDAANRLVQVSRPNGVTTGYGYDDAGRLLSIDHVNGMELLSSFEYLYDNVGNRIQAIENIQQPDVVLPTATPTNTPTASPTVTLTPTNTLTPTPTNTSTNTPTFTPTETLTPTVTNTSPPTSSPTATATTTPAYVYTLVLQPNGTDGWDTYMQSTSANTNYGTSSSMGIGENNNAPNRIARSLIKFDLSSLPADAQIVSANLSIWTSNDLSSDDDTLQVYRLKTAFNETQATWNASATGTNWQTAGANGANDRETTAIGSVSILNNQATGTEKQIALDSAKVQEMFNGTFTNHGFLIKTENETNDRFDFRTSDSSNTAQRPKLVIQYTSASSTPPPAGYIFGNGFESGNFNVWGETYLDGGDLSVSTQAAAVGSYGMQALIDDTTDIQVVDNTPNNETHYSARFYINPNSVNMPNGSANGMYVFVGDTDQYDWIVCLSMSKMGDSYTLSVCGQDDASNWLEGKDIYITNDWHAVEIEWKAASAVGTNDGYIKLWINDVLVDSITNIDNDTLNIDNASVGLVSDIPAGASGTVYFDAFESRQGQYIGLDPNGPTLTPPDTDLIFKDNFETNDFSLWDSVTSGGGDLSTSTASAMFNMYGMQALINDTSAIDLETYSPENETEYHARFYFDPNSITIPNNNGFTIFSGGGDTGSTFRLMLNYNAGTYKLLSQPFNDAGSSVSGQQIVLSDAPHCIEISFKKSTASGANNGEFKLWIDDVLVDTVSNIDNDTRTIDYVSLGAVSSIDNGTSGTIYFDQFESRRTSYIGPVSVPATATPTATQTETPTITPTPTNTETPTPTFTPTETPTPLAYLPDSVFSVISFNPPNDFTIKTDYSSYLQTTTITTINYEYDALYRLTSANYSTGDYYHYTYDAVGNRLTETTQSSVNSYQYDNANRLTSVNNVNYTFDDNGNLLSDGTNTYTYDSANRLISVNSNTTYSYNGLGDRYTQIVNNQTTTYVLDLNAGLTQVLNDGTNTYTYGLGRISQTNTETEYFLGDALGSVRQLTDNTGEITLAKSYNPYGQVTHAAGDGESIYAYTGEQTDSNGLTYLRARYYNPTNGRFLNRDTFPGYLTLSQSQNRFAYVENNPIRFRDPTGHYSWDDFVNEAQSLINDPVQHTLDQIEKNRNLPWECTDVGQIVQWAAPALAPLIIVAAIPIILVSPDAVLDLAFMVNDLRNRDYASFYLNALGLMIPGVTGLGMLSKADEAYDITKAGGGGYWKTIKEKIDSRSVKQINPLACGAACGEMLLRDRGIKVSQITLLNLTGAPTDVNQLAWSLNKYSQGWKGAFLDVEDSVGAINYLNSNGSWIAQMDGVRIDHFIVVDGFDKQGNILIRDPDEGTSYIMHIDEFLKYWKEGAVWK